MKTENINTILRSARRFFGGTVLSRISGLLRDVSMAFVFGTQESIAAFLVAFRFAHLLRRLFGEGALQTAFIPHFEELRTDHPNRACRFFRDLFALLTVLLSLLIFLSISGIAAFLYFVDLSSGNYDILFLTLLLMPSLLFICLFGLNASLLQCEKSFFIPGAAPAAFNLIWSIGVFSLYRFSAAEAMPWLAGWVILACLGQWLVTLPKTLAILRSYGLNPLFSGFNLFSADLKKLFTPLFLGVIGVAATQINNALDAVFARYASLEGPAYLWYALRLQQLPLALFGIAIAGALLPPLARALKNGNISTYHHFLEFALKRGIALMLPITAVIISAGDSAVQLIYGRGDFNAASTIGTTHCLWGYGIGLVPMTLVLILAPAFYAVNDYRTPTMASGVSVAVNIVLNGLFIMGFGYGAESVAWATSISALVNCLWLAARIPYRETFNVVPLLRTVLKTGAASVFAVMMVVWVDTVWLQGNFAWVIWNGGEPPFSKGMIDQLFRLSIQSVTFVGFLGLAAWGLGTKELMNQES